MTDPTEYDVTFALTWMANIEREATILLPFLFNFKYGWYCSVSCSVSTNLKWLNAKAESTKVSVFQGSFVFTQYLDIVIINTFHITLVKPLPDSKLLSSWYCQYPGFMYFHVYCNTDWNNIDYILMFFIHNTSFLHSFALKWYLKTSRKAASLSKQKLPVAKKQVTVRKHFTMTRLP